MLHCPSHGRLRRTSGAVVVRQCARWRFHRGRHTYKGVHW